MPLHRNGDPFKTRNLPSVSFIADPGMIAIDIEASNTASSCINSSSNGQLAKIFGIDFWLSGVCISSLITSDIIPGS